MKTPGMPAARPGLPLWAVGLAAAIVGGVPVAITLSLMQHDNRPVRLSPELKRMLDNWPPNFVQMPTPRAASELPPVPAAASRSVRIVDNSWAPVLKLSQANTDDPR